MAFGRKNGTVARADRGADVLRLAGFFGNDDLIGHDGSVWANGFDGIIIYPVRPNKRYFFCEMIRMTVTVYISIACARGGYWQILMKKAFLFEAVLPGLI